MFTLTPKQACKAHWGFNPDLQETGYYCCHPQRSGEEYLPWRCFTSLREESPVLAERMLGSYITVSWPATSKLAVRAHEVTRRGVSYDTLTYQSNDGATRHVWHDDRYVVVMGSVRDHISVIAVPERHANMYMSHPGGFLGRLGFSIEVPDESGMPKVGKYWTRVQGLWQWNAAQQAQMGSFGRILRQEGNDVLYAMTKDGAKLSMLFRSDKLPNGETDKTKDGQHFCTPRFAQLAFGLNDPREGDGLRVTVGTPLGLVKGHMVVKDDLAFDAVFFGAKTMVKYDGFFAGLLSELHAGLPFVDKESLINFLSFGEGSKLLIKNGEAFHEQLLASTRDRDTMRKMRLAMFLARDRKDEQAGEDENEWLSTAFMRADLDDCFPFLYRSSASVILPQAHHTAAGRIPFWDHAAYRYMLMPPCYFDKVGDPRPDLCPVRGNNVFSFGMPQGRVVLYRQPNGNPKECWVRDSQGATCQVVEPPDYMKRWGRGNVMWLSPDMAPDCLTTLGGADLDDPCVAVHDPEFIEVFDHLPEYPVVRL